MKQTKNQLITTISTTRFIISESSASKLSNSKTRYQSISPNAFFSDNSRSASFKTNSKFNLDLIAPQTLNISTIKKQDQTLHERLHCEAKELKDKLSQKKNEVLQRLMRKSIPKIQKISQQIERKQDLFGERLYPYHKLSKIERNEEDSISFEYAHVATVRSNPIGISGEFDNDDFRNNIDNIFCDDEEIKNLYGNKPSFVKIYRGIKYPKREKYTFKPTISKNTCRILEKMEKGEAASQQFKKSVSSLVNDNGRNKVNKNSYEFFEDLKLDGNKKFYRESFKNKKKIEIGLVKGKSDDAIKYEYTSELGQVDAVNKKNLIRNDPEIKNVTQNFFDYRANNNEKCNGKDDKFDFNARKNIIIVNASCNVNSPTNINNEKNNGNNQNNRYEFNKANLAKDNRINKNVIKREYLSGYFQNPLERNNSAGRKIEIKNSYRTKHSNKNKIKDDMNNKEKSIKFSNNKINLYNNNSGSVNKREIDIIIKNKSAVSKPIIKNSLNNISCKSNYKSNSSLINYNSSSTNYSKIQPEAAYLKSKKERGTYSLYKIQRSTIGIKKLKNQRFLNEEISSVNQSFLSNNTFFKNNNKSIISNSLKIHHGENRSNSVKSIKNSVFKKNNNCEFSKSLYGSFYKKISDLGRNKINRTSSEKNTNDLSYYPKISALSSNKNLFATVKNVQENYNKMKFNKAGVKVNCKENLSKNYIRIDKAVYEIEDNIQNYFNDESKSVRVHDNVTNDKSLSSSNFLNKNMNINFSLNFLVDE
jgi:hypothetical protein